MPESEARILVDGTKLAREGMDGNKRYVVELLSRLPDAIERAGRHWQVDVHVGNAILPIDQITDLLGDGAPDPARLASIWTRARRRLVEPTISRFREQVDPIRAEVRRRAVGAAKAVLPLPAIDVLRSFKKDPDSLVPSDSESISQGSGPPEYDFVHLTLPTSFGTFVHWARPLLATVHDVCHIHHPSYLTRGNRRALGTGLEYLLRRRSRFITVSEATRRDLIAHVGVDPREVTAIPLACDNLRFQPVHDEAAHERVRRRYDIPAGPYLLSLCTLEPRKNLAGTIRAFHDLVKRHPRIEASFVIAGRKGWKIGRLLRDRSSRSDRVHFTGYVDDADLPALYRGALGLCYVSFYEGFGLPPLEAMSCGTPVIYGNNSSMPEVVGDAGLAAKADEVDDIGRQMERLIIDLPLRRNLIDRAVRRAAEFSWERTVRQTIRAYEQILAPGSADS